MNAEFNWWLLIVGLVLGAALTWLVMAESARRDADVTESEQRGEALWIASMLSSAGRSTDSTRVEEILRLHREYLAAPPPDEPAEAEVVVPEEAESTERPPDAPAEPGAASTPPEEPP
ncbi:MAG TPA: hypothetical protein VFO05_08995 [Candidatus Limnocylindrales bacterium]|nr:hypothetical protein [Candidatus Limnocylindrales bacterium]